MAHRLMLRKRMPHTINALIVALALIAFIPACQKGSSPTATFQAFYQSLKDKNVEAYKKTVSKASLQVLETRAMNMDKTLDEYIQQEMNKPSSVLPDKLETRNEKIEGDRATLELKNTEGGWKAVPFVKEDGQWKVAVNEL